MQSELASLPIHSGIGGMEDMATVCIKVHVQEIL